MYTAHVYMPCITHNVWPAVKVYSGSVLLSIQLNQGELVIASKVLTSVVLINLLAVLG